MRATIALLLCALPVWADDRADFGGTCHPPVLGIIDPDWQEEARRFKESALRAFARHGEGEAGARRQLRVAVHLAETTRVSAYDIIQLTRELLLRGLRGRELDTLRAAALDAQTALGAEGATRFVRAVLAVRARPLVGEADLADLEELLGQPVLREALGRRLGARTPEAQQELASQRLRQGVAGAVVEGAALDALLRRVGHTEFGAAARASLGACISAMSRSCTRREAEEHCKSTPRPYLELLQKDL
ncbi:MAG: hypothetical protein RMK29_17355 [Myxococcales bacterium]|nr:hypothetical protein [Myxococcota bacterium]MDW8283478.1 hypothetical protein [Myxococcales bacterium]